MSTTMAQPTPLVPRPRILDSRVPVESLPKVEIHGGNLVVVFPSGCRWNQAERDQFVTKLRAAAEDSVKRARLAQAARKGLI